MKRRDEQGGIACEWWVQAIILGVCLLTLALCAGCKTVREYVPVEVETVRDNIVQRVDTIERHTEHTVWQQGDTVYDVRTEYRYKVRQVHDTTAVYVERPVMVEVPVEVERELTWWQRVRLGAFGWLVTALALLLAWTLRRPLLRALSKKI